MPTTAPPPIPVLVDADGYTKVGNAPYVKWTITTNPDGTKVYSMSVKETPSDTPKEFHTV